MAADILLPPTPLRSRPLLAHAPIEAHGAMVVAEDPLAAEAGLEILARGGNAVDAAVTAAFVAGVVLPLDNGLGGGGVMLVRTRDGEVGTVDYAMQTGEHASQAMFDYEPFLEPPAPDRHRMSRRFAAPAVCAQANVEGYRSISVPGTVAGLAAALARWGSIDLADAIAPAAAIAERGFPTPPSLALKLLRARALIARFPAAAAVFLPDGVPPVAGTPFRQPDQARLLRQIAQHGPEIFYRGAIAEQILADLTAHGGILTAADLADYAPRVEAGALRGAYRGIELLGATGANGCSLAIEVLQILEHFDLKALDWGEAPHLHLVIEALKAASVDRYTYLGDPEIVGTPVAALVSAAFAASRVPDIARDRAGRPHAGDLWAYADRPRPANFPGPAGVDYGGGTTHLSVVDARRNAVSLTQTNVGFSGVVHPGVGIMMNNAMRWPEMLPGTVNSIYPRARCVHNMTPMLLTGDGALHTAIGASGGRRIMSAVVQALSNVIDFGMPLQAAVQAPRIHAESDEVLFDARLGAATREALEHLGHTLHLAEPDHATAPFANVAGIQAAAGSLASGVYPCGKPGTAFAY